MEEDKGVYIVLAEKDCCMLHAGSEVYEQGIVLCVVYWYYFLVCNV